MQYEVVLLSKAQEEFHAIVDWLVSRSPRGASRWLAAYGKVIDRLEREPDHFALAPENEQFSVSIRQALFQTPRGRTYRLIFTVAEKQVRILHLRGPGQDAVSHED